ncbi:MAG TPA: hypothetical protein VMU05_24200 [Dongiaceae bacterium]|nr:hypothetical protein [Dongiaceae bacterium]
MASIPQTPGHPIVKLAFISGACIVAGLLVGTAAHFVGGAIGFGLGLGAFFLAAFEGGIPGAVIGLAVGLVVFYVIFRTRATWKDWAILMSMAFATAAVTFLPLGILMLGVTPIVTLIVALALAFNRRSSRNPDHQS